MTHVTRGIALAGALTLALVGCAAGDDAADEVVTETPSPTSGASAEETPSSPPPTSARPGEVEEDPADPSTWEIEDGEIGPVELGESFADTLAELPSDWINDSACAWVAYWSASDGSYLVSFQRDQTEDDGPVTGVTVEWLSDVTAIGPRTDEGLGVGATRDDVLASLPEAVEVDSPVDGLSFLRVAGDDADDGALFFEFADGQAGAQSVTVTALETPAYEACA
ncbi:hypothetical protein N8K70_11860 [Microbacterium betulae]|uniref:Lipoprotein n=1 Tax=Microbacterium betulae TaxID=2981139 RepID=A0AA97FIC1_9MICO|nr:hypothetical protein [Microbacterium sp. AB]WOF22072.1 hypothetical protein N8K70_11860 [Microbacterium sp. AB]